MKLDYYRYSIAVKLGQKAKLAALQLSNHLQFSQLHLQRVVEKRADRLIQIVHGQVAGDFLVAFYELRAARQLAGEVKEFAEKAKQLYNDSRFTELLQKLPHSADVFENLDHDHDGIAALTAGISSDMIVRAIASANPALRTTGDEKPRFHPFDMDSIELLFGVKKTDDDKAD